MQGHMPPADRIIELLGGAAVINRALGVPISTICAWSSPKMGRGSIPKKYWDALKTMAKNKGWILTSLQLLGEETLPS